MMCKKNMMKIIILIIFSVFFLSCFGGCTSTNSLKNNDISIPNDAQVLDTYITDVYGNSDAIVTIISDDGFFYSGMCFTALMKKYHIKGTVAGAVCNVDPFIDDWKKLYAEGCIEMVNHSYDHIKMSEDSKIANNNFSLRHQIIDSKKYIEKEFGTKQIAFVCPENTMCTKGYEILANGGYWAVRKGDRGFNSLSPADGYEPGDWFNLKCYGIMDAGVNTAVRNSWVDTAIDEHVWLIEMWHNVMPSDDGMYQTILINDAMEHLEYVGQKSDSNSIWVATYTEAVKYIRERQNSNVYAYISNNQLHLFVELTNDDMDYEIFDQPVTVAVSIPDKEICYYDVVPGTETIINLTEQT